MATTTVDTAQKAPETTASGPVVIDLGKKRRGQVKKLRKGRGKLMDRVNELVADLHNNGTLSSKGQTVVVVVKERRNLRRMGMF